MASYLVDVESDGDVMCGEAPTLADAVRMAQRFIRRIGIESGQIAHLHDSSRTWELDGDGFPIVDWAPASADGLRFPITMSAAEIAAF